jgi:hypothetical protein
VFKLGSSQAGVRIRTDLQLSKGVTPPQCTWVHVLLVGSAEVRAADRTPTHGRAKPENASSRLDDS